MSSGSTGWLIVGVLAAVWFAPACLLELETDIACGDGFLDEAAGEECEPRMPETFLDACLGTAREDGVGACNRETCQIENDRLQCGVCGDGKVDVELGEDCDGDDLNGRRCPGAGGGEGLQCTIDCKYDNSQCELCGNGTIDEGEECDSAPGGFVAERPCAGTETQAPLAPFWADKPYTGGTVNACLPQRCTYNRIQCNYCGDGQRDPETSVGPDGALAPAEWCDGGDKDEDRLREEFPNLCMNEYELPNAACGEDCATLTLRFPEDPPCCRKRGAACAALTDPTKCCYAYDHPDEDPCEETYDGINLSYTCK